MSTHLLHREWDTTHCGKPTQGLGDVTTLMARVTCADCYQVYRTLCEINNAKPEQFA